MSTKQTAAQLEIEIDAMLTRAGEKTAEIERIETVITTMQGELSALDGRIAAVDAEAAAAELKARLDGGKPPKASAEADTLGSSRRRLLAAVEAAKGMQADLAGQRDEALKVADMLARNNAGLEFAEQARAVAAAWNAFHDAFATYSAASQHAGYPGGWNNPAAFSPHPDLRFEAIEGARVRFPDFDGQVLAAAVARSNAARVAAKIYAARA